MIKMSKFKVPVTNWIFLRDSTSFSFTEASLL
jgi:hypothetical protein